jgi:hypothetical protein
MILPDEIIVVGDDLEAETLRQVLRFCVRECHRHTYSAIWGVQAGSSRLRRDLDNSPLIVALSVGGNPTAQILPLIYKLRTHLGWIGAFIAVVQSADEVKQLNVASISGARNGGHQFGLVDGHAALSRPLLLSELFSTIKSVGEMHRHRWDGLVRQSSTPLLLEAVKRANELVGGGDDVALVAAVEEALDFALDLDWLTLLNEDYVHQGIHLLNDLQGVHAQNKLLRADDCESIIKKIDHIISKSCIGDDA